MNLMYHLFIILSSIFVSIHATEVDIDLSVDTTGWIDPSDPLSHHLLNYNDKNTEVARCDCGQVQRNLLEENGRLREQLNAIYLIRENSVDILMKHVLRQFLLKLNIDLNKSTSGEIQPIFKKAMVSLSIEDLSIIKKYLQSEREVEEFGLREHLRGALENFVIEIDIRSNNSLLTLLHSLLPYIFFLNILLLLPAAFIIIRWICSFSRFCLIMFIIAFGLSCYFTYIRKYQEILAQRFERADRAGTDGKHPCSPQGLVSEAFDLLLSYVTIKDKSECLKSYEDMLIEPFLLVDPLQILAEVMSNFFLAPLSVAGLHLNHFFKHFYGNTPIHLALLMTLFLFLMPLLMIWATLKIRGHLARERRDEEHQRMIQMQNQPLQLSDQKVTEIRERKIRRRALGPQINEKQQQNTTNELAGSSATDSDSSIREIRERLAERRKWE